MKHMLLSLLLPIVFLFQSEARTKMNTETDRTYLKAGIHNNLLARVYFSTQIPIDGIATEDKVFYIKPQGSFLYVIVDNYPSPIRYNKIKLYVYKTVDGSTIKTDEGTYEIDGSISYTYIKYNFYTPGNYIFDVFGTDGVYLGTGKVEIKSSKVSTTDYLNTSGPRVYFSTETPVYGIAQDVKSFRISPNGGFVYVIVDNYPNLFKVKTLRLLMYKYVNGYYFKRDETAYKIDGNLYFTYFKYTFYESGDYKFVVYDANGNYVSTGYVTITY